ncbi:hypothetical protein TNCT_166541 [Trichonephila clavata]|uniref:Uncharacterized protein n=1 Tax=Trichonephila clavata TaxID=2740835 RepID=A0A8X6L5I0_TRICU|nr:hypothetical protein TNCT_166541 [Trichonephila clavata]
MGCKARLNHAQDHSALSDAAANDVETIRDPCPLAEAHRLKITYYSSFRLHTSMFSSPDDVIARAAMSGLKNATSKKVLIVLDLFHLTD